MILKVFFKDFVKSYLKRILLNISEIVIKINTFTVVPVLLQVFIKSV